MSLLLERMRMHDQQSLKPYLYQPNQLIDVTTKTEQFMISFIKMTYVFSFTYFFQLICQNDDKSNNCIIQQSKMEGSSQKKYKDSSINVLITYKKSFYYAGEMVEGVVYVECLADMPYIKLLLRLQGNERVSWRQYSEDSSTDYDNTRQTYNQVFTFHKFPNRFRKGKYKFPFKLLLPAAFPASFEQDPSNFIKYSLSIIFVPLDNQPPLPIYERTLHIREPPRLPFNQMGFRIQSFEPIECHFCCCGSCCGCGQVELTLQTDTYALTPGQNLRVYGKINNIGGSLQVKGFEIQLFKCVKKVAYGGKSSVDYPSWYVLHQSSQLVPRGQDHQFDLMVKIPNMGLSYTAIGNIIYRAYFLRLSVCMGCCITQPSIQRYVFLSSKTEPPNDENRKIPAGWNPQPTVNFVNLQPYKYWPNIAIDVRNQSGMPIQARI